MPRGGTDWVDILLFAGGGWRSSAVRGENPGRRPPGAPGPVVGMRSDAPRAAKCVAFEQIS
jgi:hypothetical protein